jgi:DnaJ-class molecular chaperone
MIIKSYKNSCKACESSGHFMGAGMIKHKCQICGGIGYLEEIKEINTIESETLPTQEVKIKKKPGPKRKYNEMQINGG